MQVQQLRRAIKGERLTRELVTQELRKSLAHQKRSQRRLAERDTEVEQLQQQVQELAQHAALAHRDLQDKESVVKVGSQAWGRFTCCWQWSTSAAS